MNIAGKVAIVTGAGGVGSGRAYACRLAREGAVVVVNDVNEDGARETVQLIEAAGGRAAAYVANIGIEDEVPAMIDFTVATFGGLDILVNNASPAYHIGEPLDWWYEPITIDLLGAMATIRHAIPQMRRRGGGAIVNISSTSAVGHGYKHSSSPAYDVAKAGQIRLTTTLGWLAEKENIRVNCLAPDWVAVPEVLEYWNGLTPDERRAQGVPAVLTTLDEVADAVVELIADDNLAGRVMVWWSGQERGVIPKNDPGYERLERSPKR